MLSPRTLPTLIRLASASFLALAALQSPAQSLAQPPAQTPAAPWHFSVSGDSRNCGDLIMPAIAAGAKHDGAEFYWHLGDFRKLSGPDEDYLDTHPGATDPVYQTEAWPDFIAYQMESFGTLPVYLGLGNHELVHRDRTQVLSQFHNWFDSPAVHAQRLADDPADTTVHTWFHITAHNVDFITLDNASSDQLDDAQLAWFESLLKRDAANPAIRTIIVGMHEALPDSLSAGHSMNQSRHGILSGRRAYQSILDFRKSSKKRAYLLASHSHFLVDDAWDSTCRAGHPEDVLPGWIVGTAGAQRYNLPPGIQTIPLHRQTDTYGYLLATVDPDGKIFFDYRAITAQDALQAQTALHTQHPSLKLFSDSLVNFCFSPALSPKGNHGDYTPALPTCDLTELH